MEKEEGGEWYHSILFDKLSCRQLFFSGPKGTPSREEHKTFSNSKAKLKVLSNENRGGWRVESSDPF
jgi:hypothetical protein